MVQARSGIPIATCFSAVKLRWLLDSQDNVAAAHYEGRLLAGEAPALHVLHTDPLLQASRTGLMNIHTQTWDTQLATFYVEPLNIMPRVLASGDIFDMLEMTSLVGVNIPGCMGDQQAAIVGHCCTSPGMSQGHPASF
jgi:glycerol kinase